jgi:signal transduction histidine kinase
MAIYAKTSCLSSDGISIFRRALGERPALPPSATRGLSNDSLLVVLVEDARGNVLWRSDSTTYSTMVTSGAVESPRLGNARIRAEIRPAAAESLVIGGVPASRLPVALLLLLLATGFAAFAIAQIRRQQMLIRTRERFVANVSHELRTPLQQILVFTELLRMGKVRNEGERQHSLEVIERETHRLILLVDNVLRFSRIDRSGAEPVGDTVDVAALARETVQTFDPLARTSDATVILDAESAHAMGDADSIRRVLLNLLDNAAKYGPRGQEIRVVVRRRGDRTIVSVEDEGPGVPEAERAGIWEPFRRLERDEAGSIAGSGMGLAIVRDLVRRMEGDVWMDERSSGASFTFDLPAAVADMSRAGDRTMSPAASRTGETNAE